MLLSIIIPVYNVESYVARCLKSIENQTIEDYEVLVIDDGSTDKSLKICREFSKKNNKFQVFHKENGGLSDARNYGLKVAKGKYIAFLDSDDFVVKDAYEKLLEVAENYNTDVVVGNGVKYISKNEKYPKAKKTKFS